MSKKLTGTEKLNAVLQHQKLRRAKAEFASVEELCAHYGITGEHLRQWHDQLVERAEEIYEDRRLHRERAAYELEVGRLKRRIEHLERELPAEFPDEED